MATVNLTGNQPKNLTMNDFRAINDMYGSLQKSCRFIVRILPVGDAISFASTFLRDFMYLCEAGEFPGRSFQSADVRYYGPNHKLPFNTQYEDINLTFLVRNKSYERQFFDDWQMVINPNNSWDFNYRDDYRAQIDVWQFDEYGARAPQTNSNAAIVGGESLSAPTAQYCLTIYNAYPIVVNPQPVTWADDQFQRVVVSFTYTHWVRPIIDPDPQQFRLVDELGVRVVPD